MKHAVHEDPDIILVGELRDRNYDRHSRRGNGAPRLRYDSRFECFNDHWTYLDLFPEMQCDSISDAQHEGDRRPKLLKVLSQTYHVYHL